MHIYRGDAVQDLSPDSVLVVPVDIKLKAAVALKRQTDHPILLVDQLGRLAGLCGDEEIYASLLRRWLRLVPCSASRYTLAMIRSFRHKGLQILFFTGSTKGVQAAHAGKLRRILAVLDAAASPADLNHPGYKLHPLRGDMSGYWSIWVSGNWRVTFRFIGADTELVDYQDYH